MWASTAELVPGTNPPILVTNVLGAPNSTRSRSSFWDDEVGTLVAATFSGFGAGDVGDYEDLAALLGVPEGVLARADFISFEHAGTTGLRYEECTWLFDDGVNSFEVQYSPDSPPAAVIGLGNVWPGPYVSYFGLGPWPHRGDFPLILIDVDGFSNVNPRSPNLRVTLLAEGTPPDSPDPMNMAGIGVPQLPVDIDLAAGTLNLGSKGQWITCYLAPPTGYSASEIASESVLLEGVIAPARGQVEDGRLMVKFDRSAVQDFLAFAGVIPPAEVTLSVTARLIGGPAIGGSDTIRVIKPGKKK